MSVRGMVSVAAVLLTLTGCAKTNKDVLADGTAIVPHQDQGAANSAKPDVAHLHPAGGDGLLPYDPIATAAPMPVAVLELIKRLNQPDHGGAVAFLDPIVTNVSYDRDAPSPTPVATLPYQLDSGDRVRVFVYGQPNLSHIYPIDEAGFIDVPLIGAVKARGATTYRLARQIATQLQVSFVKDAQVSVELAVSRPFYILGEVRAAGQYPYQPGLTVQTAVAIAGGFGPRASEREVRIKRRANGMIDELHAGLNDPIRPGDTIAVDERWF